MSEWENVRKLDAMAPIEMGLSEVHRLISRNSGAGVALGFSELKPGNMEMEVSDPELFVVLEGQMTVSCRTSKSIIEEGQAIWLPPKTNHVLSISKPCRVLYVIVEG